MVIPAVKISKRAQTWSTDTLVAAAIFVLALIIFFYVISLSTEKNIVEELKLEGVKIPLKFVSSSEGNNDTLVFIIGNKVDKEKLQQIASMSYYDLKRKLGIKNDFCIYFEDENGNLINISDIVGIPVAGIGSPNVTISGIQCGNP